MPDAPADGGEASALDPDAGEAELEPEEDDAGACTPDEAGEGCSLSAPGAPCEDEAGRVELPDGGVFTLTRRGRLEQGMDGLDCALQRAELRQEESAAARPPRSFGALAALVTDAEGRAALVVDANDTSLGPCERRFGGELALYDVARGAPLDLEDLERALAAAHVPGLPLGEHRSQRLEVTITSVSPLVVMVRFATLVVDGERPRSLPDEGEGELLSGTALLTCPAGAPCSAKMSRVNRATEALAQEPCD